MLKNYVENLKLMGVNLDAFHWRAPNKIAFEKGYKMLIKLEQDFGLLNDNNRLVNECKQKLCLNPLHYIVKEKPKRILNINKTEVDELATMIDLGSLEDLGFENYLESFNMGNPLPARAVDFFAACNRQLGKARKPLLDESILDGLDEAEI